MRTVKAKTVKVGVIGAGRMARIGHLHWLERHPSVEIAGIADTNPDAARGAAKKHHATAAYESAEELIEKAKPHAVIVCTPPWSHRDIVVMAAENRAHVFCEKPMSLKTSECKKMIDACRDNGVFLQLGFVNRFDPGFMKIKEMIRNGDLGEVFQITGFYHTFAPDPDTEPLKQVFDVIESLGIPYEQFVGGLWRTRDPRAGGVLADHSVHLIDLFRWFAGGASVACGEVESFSGHIQRIYEGRASDDHATVLLRFEDGANAYIESSLCPLSARRLGLHGEIHGSKMSLSFTHDSPLWFVKGPPLYYNTHAKVKKFSAPSLVTGQWAPVRVNYGKNHFMCKTQMDHFIQAITGKLKTNPAVGEGWAGVGEDGLETTRIVEKIYRAERKKINK